jgi:predicted nucleic acid-binding protein
VAKKPVVVLDTNVFVSGLLSPNGVPGQILLRFRNGQFEIVTSKDQIKVMKVYISRRIMEVWTLFWLFLAKGRE